MPDDKPSTPIQDAMFLITVASVLVAGACYMACINNVPVVSWVLYWVATVIYAHAPIIARLQGAQAPYLVSSASIGLVFFILAVPFASQISRLCGPNVKQMENQMKSRTKTQRSANIQ